ncbi:MAG TPA: LLM class flavin-dependent oxidoreductase [Candidatus Binatia bacterium]|jgi:alkanesulfonate monooxygenase SsuD/methylene tetrahydromethanopterin reductase-like flavin-dependent oxidoreductase (luciferase family)
MRKLPVTWGLSLPNRGVLFGLTDVDTILNAAVLAEDSGVFESVWFGDSLIHKPRLDSIVMLSAAATRTRKVRLGVICMASFPVRHPVLLGIQWASLDQLSKGRTILAVCIGGGHEGEMRAFGVQKNERVGRLTEGVKLLRKIWSEEELNHDGKFYRLQGYRIVPKPVQKPCPIWIAVSPDRATVGDEGVARAMKRVATLGDGYISMAVTPEEMACRLELIEKYAAEIGKSLDNFEVAIHGMININDDKRKAYEEAKYYFDNYYTPGYPSEALIKIWLAHGPPEECAGLIQSWIDMGFTTPVLRFASRNQIGQIERFITDVLPFLRLK